MNFEHLADPLPVPITSGQQGEWEIDSFSLTEGDVSLSNLRAMRDGQYEMMCKPGTFTRLTHKKRGVIMSNTPMEVSTNLPFIKAAKGRVLISGLGLGMVLRAVLDKSEVESVTVHEIDKDVITLVSPGFINEIESGRLVILHSNCFEYKPSKGETYDVAWHDIWDTICSDNIKEMGKLTRKWARRIPVQLCWARRMCERMNRY